MFRGDDALWQQIFGLCAIAALAALATLVMALLTSLARLFDGGIDYYLVMGVGWSQAMVAIAGIAWVLLSIIESRRRSTAANPLNY